MARMELTHDNIMDFMKRYFKAYSTLAQDPETKKQMYEYYAPEMKSHHYFTPEIEVIDLERFLLISSSHSNVKEVLIPEHIVVDDRQKMAGVLVRGEFTDKETGQVIEHMFMAHYQLKVSKDKTIKIKDLWLFSQYVPPEKPNPVFAIHGLS